MLTARQVIEKCYLIRMMQAYHSAPPIVKNEKCGGYRDNDGKVHKKCKKCRVNNDT